MANSLMAVQLQYKHRQRKAIGSNENTNCNFSSDPFWTHDIKTKASTNIVSNKIHLLSAAGPVPYAEPIPASWLLYHPL